jgi:iron complex outermembrane receptor protein
MQYQNSKDPLIAAKRLPGRALRLALLATTLVPVAAIAQTAPGTTAAAAPDTGTVQEIVVTAQKREEKLSNVPITVSTVSPHTLQTAGIMTPADLQNIVPGLVADPGAVAGAFFTPYIRGVGTAATAVGNDPSVATFIDGVYQSDKGSNIFDLNDVDHIEVLKGPQGTLFGRNATGGAINVVSRKPSFITKIEAEASYGKYDKSDEKLYVTGPLSSTLAASLAVNNRDGGNFIKIIDGPGHSGGTSATSLSARLLWQPGSDFSAELSYMYNKSRTTNLVGSINPVAPNLGAIFGGLDAPDPYTTTAAQAAANYLTTQADRVALNMRYSLGTVDLVSISGYVNDKTYQSVDYDASSATVFGFVNPTSTKDFSQEFQIVSTTAGKLKYVIGAYFLSNHAAVNGLEELIGVPFPGTDAQTLAAPGGLKVVANVSGPITAYAGYAQGTYAFDPNTNLTLGARYSVEVRRYTFQEQAVGQLAPGFVLPALTLISAQPGEESTTFRAPTWRISLDHHFTDDVMVYASENRGFKSGGYNFQSYNVGQQPVNPEKLDAYEIGAKTKWLDRKLQINLSTFYYNYRNIQIERIDPGISGGTQLQNAPGEKLYGLDAEAVLVPVRDLHLSASASLLHAKYDALDAADAYYMPGSANSPCPANPANVPCSGSINATGFQGLYAPKYSFTLAADYTAHLPGGWSLLVSGNYFRTGQYLTTISEGNFATTGPYGLLSASVTLNDPSQH